MKTHHFTIQRRGQQREHHKNKRVNEKKQQLCIVHYTFPFLHYYDVKMPNFAFYGERKQATTKFYFPFWAYSALGEFAYSWQSKWIGIIAIKTERTQIHFLSDVLVAVASLDLKAPNDSKGLRSGKSTRLSHHCGPGSNPGVDAICGSSLLLVLSIVLKNFFLVLLFSPLSKQSTFPISNSTRNGTGRWRTTMWTSYI